MYPVPEYEAKDENEDKLELKRKIDVSAEERIKKAPRPKAKAKAAIKPPEGEGKAPDEIRKLIPSGKITKITKDVSSLEEKLICLQTAVLEARSPELHANMPVATVEKAEALVKDADVLCKLGKELEATKGATKADLKKIGDAKTVADGVKKMVERLNDLRQHDKKTVFGEVDRRSRHKRKVTCKDVATLYGHRPQVQDV